MSDNKPDVPGAIWEEHDGPLKTKPGMVRGIIDTWKDEQDRSRTMVQCAVCYVTCTNISILALGAVNHRGVPDDGPFFSPTLPYKRCPKCRNANKFLPDDEVG